MDQPQQLGHPRVRQGATGEGLDRDSRVLERPRFAEAVNNRTRIVSTAVGVEEAALGFQNLFRAGPPQGSKVGSNYATLRGMTSLEGLHHGAEVFAQAGSMAGGNRQSADCLLYIKSFEAGASCCAPEDAAGSGGMKAVLIMPGGNRLSDLALHFHAQLIGEQQIPATLALQFRRR